MFAQLNRIKILLFFAAAEPRGTETRTIIQGIIFIGSPRWIEQQGNSISALGMDSKLNFLFFPLLPPFNFIEIQVFSPLLPSIFSGWIIQRFKCKVQWRFQVEDSWRVFSPRKLRGFSFCCGKINVRKKWAFFINLLEGKMNRNSRFSGLRIKFLKPEFQK